MIIDNAGKHLEEQMTSRATGRGGLGLLHHFGVRVLMLSLLWTVAGVSYANNRLEEISYRAGSGGQVELIFGLSSPPEEPNVFTTESPARIAIDLENTTNGLEKRSLTVGSGSTNRVTTVEAGGRTRVVIELFRPSEYSLRIEGNSLIVSVGNDVPVAAQGDDPSGAGMALTNVDFRRGLNGEGKIILSFSGPGAVVDLVDSLDQIELDIYGASIPKNLERRLDVIDFATPVSMVDTFSRGENIHVAVMTNGDYEHLAYQAGNEYVIEVVEPAPEESKDFVLDLSEKEYEGDRVTFNFQDIPVRTVLQLIADFSELNIVVGDTVQGNVTLRLINVPWDQALDILLDSKSLDQRRNGNVIWVAPATEIAQREQQLLQAQLDKEQLEPLRTDYVQVNYAKASELAKLLKRADGEADTSGAILSSRGSVAVDERTNMLLVNDTVERLRAVRELVTRLDRPVQQVQIESRIVVATNDFKRELGARFGVTGTRADHHGNLLSTSGQLESLDRMTNSAIRARQSDPTSIGLPNIDYLNGPGSPLAGAPIGERLNVNLPVVGAAGSFGVTILAADYLLDLELSALESEGRGEVISSPRVVTANQKEARISQGQAIGYQEKTSSGATSTKFRDVTLSLKVTPLITPDNRIIMDLEVKKDNLVGFFGIDDIPVIDTRKVVTQVLVSDGETVVLGGIYESLSNVGADKVPGLGDVPGLGALFRKTTKLNEKAELLIFVTPTILEYSVGFE